MQQGDAAAVPDYSWARARAYVGDAEKPNAITGGGTQSKSLRPARSHVYPLDRPVGTSLCNLLSTLDICSAI